MKAKIKKEGFTLVELLLVIVIIGILSALLGPSFLDFSRKKDIEYSVDSFKTTLSEAFSSSRSSTKIYQVAIGGRPDNDTVKTYSYDYTSCCANGICEFSNSNTETEACMNSKQEIYQEPFLGTVKLIEPMGGFSIYFLPPHGDIVWNGRIENDGVLEVVLADEYDHEKPFKIYERSGLVGN